MPADGMASTIVQGAANLPVCNAQRLLLEFYVYGSPPPASPAGPFGGAPPVDGLPPPIASKVESEVQNNWECTAEINDVSGLRAQCWEAKDRKKNPYSCCAPTLIFRGSRDISTHLSDLAVYMRIDFVNHPGTYADICFLPDKTDVNVPDDSSGAIAWGGSGMGLSRSAATNLRSALQNAGWQQFGIIDETRSVQTPDVTDDSFFGLGMRLQVEVWAGQNGDWVNNFRQGWGSYSRLYSVGMNWAAAQVTNLQSQYDPPRVFFTGHSLGGGVASAAAQFCAHKFASNKKLSLRGLTFNSAGLHPNTVAPASTKAAPVFDYSVRDEILTTLQSRSGDMPFIGSILRIANHKLPEAVTNITIRPGISPGGFVVLPTPAANGKPATPGIPFPPPGTPLPALFPLKNQTVFPPPSGGGDLFPNVTKADAVFSKSQTVLELLQNLIEMIHDTYLPDAQSLKTQYDQDMANTWSWLKSTRSNADKIWMNTDFYVKSFRNFYAAISPELDRVKTLFGYSTAYHLMPSVAETYYGKV